MDVRIYPPEEMIQGAIELPLSKSISNRALIMNALTPGSHPLEQVAVCDDTKAVEAALSVVANSNGGKCEINVGPAGTAMRFLAAYLAATPGVVATIDGSERMRQRPIGPLVDALRRCGADIEYAEGEGYPPLRVSGRKLHGGSIDIDATVSSQFISALLMVAPTFDAALTINLKGEPSSLPYLKMTLAMMRQRGINAELSGNQAIVQPGVYMPCSEPIERDWSAASYWYEVGAMSGGWITLPGLSLPSMQGDSALAEIFEKIGILTEPAEEGDGYDLNPTPELHSRLDIDLSDTPDIAQTLAVTCCLLGIPFRFEGLASLRVKETDRLQALKTELAKLSFDVEIERDSALVWQYGRTQVESIPPIDTYGDHRMAMAFAPVAIFVSGLTIRDAEVVSKSYPEFWDHMRSLGFTIEEVDGQ